MSMESIILVCIICGIPAIFLILFIINIARIIKSKKEKVAVKKSLIAKSIVFGVIFILIIIFYLCMWVLLSMAVAHM